MNQSTDPIASVDRDRVMPGTEQPADSDVKMQEASTLSLEQFALKTDFEPLLCVKALGLYDFLFQHSTLLSLPLVSMNLVVQSVNW